MKKLFNAFMKRAIHDDEMERAQELAKGFPDDIALPQAMGFQAGYNAAIAELESEKSATENYDDIGYLVDKFNDQPLVSLTVTNISKFFDNACKIYHAKKCAECVEKFTCETCGNQEPNGCKGCYLSDGNISNNWKPHAL